MSLYSLSNKSEECLKCRIFIGNLPSDNISKDVLKNIFSQYGSYIDCSIFRNFGFVQYGDEKSANDAVQATHGTCMFERKLDVKIANAARKDGKKYVNKHKKRNLMDIRPLMSRQPLEPNYPNYNSIQIHSSSNSHMYNTPYQNIVTPPSSKLPPPPSSLMDRVSSTNLPTNECLIKYCEIICTSKKQLNYAEFIEYTLTNMGFITNINILGTNYPIEIVLNRISRDNVLMAVTLKDENEAHHSLNLHIFIGTPEEHRNMPVDVAENFIRKRFIHITTSKSDDNNTTRSFSYTSQSSTNNNKIDKINNNHQGSLNNYSNISYNNDINNSNPSTGNYFPQPSVGYSQYSSNISSNFNIN